MLRNHPSTHAAQESPPVHNTCRLQELAEHDHHVCVQFRGVKGAGGTGPHLMNMFDVPVGRKWPGFYLKSGLFFGGRGVCGRKQTSIINGGRSQTCTSSGENQKNAWSLPKINYTLWIMQVWLLSNTSESLGSFGILLKLRSFFSITQVNTLMEAVVFVNLS